MSENPGCGKKRVVIVVGMLLATPVLLYSVISAFIARSYLIPSEAMAPTLRGC